METSASEDRGPIPIEQLRAIFVRGGITVSGDYARQYAAEVAVLACLGMISTWNGATFGRRWRITARGAACWEANS